MRYLIELKGRKEFPNEVAVHGVDMGNGTKPILLHSSLPSDITKLSNEWIESREKNSFACVMVLKVPGGLHWSRRGDPFRYHAASFKVLRIVAIKEEDEHRYYQCDEIIDFDIRAEAK